MDPYAYSLGACSRDEARRYFHNEPVETEDEEDMTTIKPNRFVYDLPAETYFAQPGLSGSLLIHGAVSMKAMRYYAQNESDPSPAMRWGSIVHAALLEPERFDRDVVIFDGPKRGKDWLEFQSANDGRSIITSEDSEQLAAMIQAVHGRADAKALLTEGDREVSMFWESPDYGKAKGRMDVYLPSVQIVDLKTTKSLTRFKDTSARLLYHVKCGWYQIGVREITGAKDYLPVYVVAVETDPPFDVQVFEYDAEALAIGRDMAMNIAKQYRACEKSGRYPGRCEDVTTLRLPEWMIEQEMRKIDASEMQEMEAVEL